MTRSSKARRARAKSKKYGFNSSANSSSGAVNSNNESQIVLSEKDKRYLIAFTVLSLIITAIYWSMGGRNLFIFPALLCISVGVRKYWTGPIRRYADQ